MLLPPTTLTTITQYQTQPVSIQQRASADAGSAFQNIRLRNNVDKIIAKNEKLGVTTDVSIIDLQTQQTIVGHNLDTEQFAASINKETVK